MTSINATNPAQLRQEAQRLLNEGWPAVPAILNAITVVEPDFGYEVACVGPDCRPLDGCGACSPPLTHQSRFAGASVRGIEALWARDGSTGVLARQWDPQDCRRAVPLAVWEYQDATAAAQTIGFDLSGGAHTSIRRQDFWFTGRLLLVLTSSEEHGEVMHTIEPIMPTNRAARRKQGRPGRTHCSHH